MPKNQNKSNGAFTPLFVEKTPLATFFVIFIVIVIQRQVAVEGLRRKAPTNRCTSPPAAVRRALWAPWTTR